MRRDAGNFFGWGNIGWFNGDPAFPATWEFCIDTGSWQNGSCPIGGLSVPPGKVLGKFHLLGDPQVVADGLGNVVLVALAESDTSDQDLIVAVASIDGGRTFGPTTIVNDTNCSDHEQDQPTAAFDPNTNELFIAWRHQTLWGHYEACMRGGGTVNAMTSTINWNGHPPFNVDNLITESPLHGVGGLIIQANQSKATIVYSSTDDAATCFPANTITGGGSGGAGSEDMAYYSITTSNYGDNWSPSHIIASTNQFNGWCHVDGLVSTVNRTFGFVIDSADRYYAAVSLRRDRLHLLRSVDQGNTWPNNPQNMYVALSDRDSAFWPTLASSGPGIVALTYCSNLATDSTGVAVFARGNYCWGEPTAWDESMMLGLPYTMRQGIFLGANDRTVGDYMGLAVKSTDSARTGLGTSIFSTASVFLSQLSTPSAAVIVTAQVNVTPSLNIVFKNAQTCP